jgi:hypothetical protein
MTGHEWLAVDEQPLGVVHVTRAISSTSGMRHCYYDPVERSESVEAPLVFVGDKLPSRGAFDVLPLVEDLA